MAKVPDYSQAIINDSSGRPLSWSISANFGSFVTQDAKSPSPVLSPLQLSTNISILTVPTNAIKITVYNGGGYDVYISEDGTMTHYFVLNVQDTITIDVAKMSLVYLKAKQATPTISFLFSIL